MLVPSTTIASTRYCITYVFKSSTQNFVFDIRKKRAQAAIKEHECQTKRARVAKQKEHKLPYKRAHSCQTKEHTVAR
jgi:hypothetical protein